MKHALLIAALTLALCLPGCSGGAHPPRTSPPDDRVCSIDDAGGEICICVSGTEATTCPPVA